MNDAMKGKGDPKKRKSKLYQEMRPSCSNHFLSHVNDRVRDDGRIFQPYAVHIPIQGRWLSLLVPIQMIGQCTKTEYLYIASLE